MIFTELPVLERAAAARAAGFDAVEFWWPFAQAVPSDREADAFARSVTDAGVQLVGLNFFAGDMPGGDRGVISWPGREAELRDNLDVAMGLGERLGIRAFNALYGNRLDGVDPRGQDELAVENLNRATAAAARIGATVLLEPVSGAPRYPLRTAAQVTSVLDLVGAANLALLADFYHLAVNGDDVPAVLARDFDRIRHVQIADSPGRGEPGTGGLPLTEWLGDLARRGYDDWVGLEYTPATADPFAWLPRADRGAARHSTPRSKA
jgi:hydroxypyruvate isomerase